MWAIALETENIYLKKISVRFAIVVFVMVVYVVFFSSSCSYLCCNFCFVILNILQKVSILGYSESLGWHKYSETSPPHSQKKIKEHPLGRKKVSLFWNFPHSNVSPRYRRAWFSGFLHIVALIISLMQIYVKGISPNKENFSTNISGTKCCFFQDTLLRYIYLFLFRFFMKMLIIYIYKYIYFFRRKITF